MKLLILVFVAAISASNVDITILTPHSHPIASLYHSQDALGQYAYGYATPTATKAETKTADGVTQGGYSYIDSNGLVQTVHYTSDPINGFRVAATNLPQDLPEVAAAKARHLAQFAQDLPEVAVARAQHLTVLKAAYSGAIQAPQDLPEVAQARAQHLAIVEQTKARDAAAHLSPVYLTGNVVPVHAASVTLPVGDRLSYTPVVSQYHSQDELGQYSYGYVGPLSAKAEAKTADGVTRGGYSYIDANGVLQTVNYVADAIHGFRVAATNLPVGPKLESSVVDKKVAVGHIIQPLYAQEIHY